MFFEAVRQRREALDTLNHVPDGQRKAVKDKSNEVILLPLTDTKNLAAEDMNDISASSERAEMIPDAIEQDATITCDLPCSNFCGFIFSSNCKVSLFTLSKTPSHTLLYTGQGSS
jgi:hypothetical protein